MPQISISWFVVCGSVLLDLFIHQKIERKPVTWVVSPDKNEGRKMRTSKLCIYHAFPPLRKLSRAALYLMIIASVMLNLSGMVWAQKTERPHPEKTMMAVQIDLTLPEMDGVLDDPVWRYAPVYDDFTQRDPDEGASPTERTTVQVAYDDEALYVGIMCYDSEPDRIAADLRRRDGLDDDADDWVGIAIDSHHDHQTAYDLRIAASGTLADTAVYSDNSWDSTWDGVWEAQTTIHSEGWSAEFRIPYHVLRFSQQDAYIWGINFQRSIGRKQEQMQWVLIPRAENAWVSRFGHLEGIQGISPPARLEALPYAVGRSSFVPKSAAHPNGRDLFSSLGGDLRYGLSSNISLNATVNPDFGQVEADTAVLNLSVFETFFQERRPFFIEGNTIFQTPNPDILGISSPPRLFYSRRIGKQPGQFPTPGDSEVIHRPDATTILGAAKLSGKTASKTSFGIMEAVTSPEYATIEEAITDPVDSTERREHLMEPLTNFFVGRVQQDVQTNSTVGAMLTTVNRRGVTPAYVAEVDTHLKWKENAYNLFTRLAGSRTGPLDERINGYSAQAYFYKFTGTFGGQFYLDARSTGFDVNDLGFMNRSNWIQSGGHFNVKIQNPWALARQSVFNVNAWSHWNYDDRLNLRKGVNFNTWHQLKNYWFFQIGFSRDFETLDDLETRGGPLMVRPARTWYWVNFRTDSRKSISFRLNTSGERLDGGSSWERGVSVTANIRPVSNIQLEIGPSYETGIDFAQWVRNVDDDGDGEYDHYVFGELDGGVLSLSTRANVAFTTNLSLQLYLRSFVATGDYSSFKELARPESYDFIPYTDLDDNPDFSQRSLRGNVVLRWEYRPGSALFLVWSQSRSASLDVDDPEFQPLEGVGKSFTNNGEDIFLIKLSYWLVI